MYKVIFCGIIYVILHGAQHRKDTALWEHSPMLIKKAERAVPALSKQGITEKRSKTQSQVIYRRQNKKISS